MSISARFSDLKFRYDTPSFATLSTLNNPQDLDLEATLPVK